MIVTAPALSSYYAEARAEFEDLLVELDSSGAMELTHGQAEELIDSRGREVLLQLFQGWISAQGLGDVGACVQGADGIERLERRRRGRNVESLFGEVKLVRFSYEEPGAPSLRPLDAELNIPEELYSHGVRRKVAKQAAKEPFGEVVLGLQENTGAKVPKRQAEQLTMRAAADVDAFYEEQRSSEKKQEKSNAPILVMTSDGKGVPMRKNELKPATRKKALSQSRKMQKRLPKGEKRSCKRMATVAGVYTIEKFVRSPEQIMSELRPVREATKERRPRPVQKRIWASLGKEPKQVIKEMFEEALSRDPKQEKRWVAVIDGNKSQIQLIRKQAKLHGIELTLILDFIHMLEYLWKASYALYAQGSVEAERWVTEQLKKVLSGRAKQVAANMRRSATRAGLAAKQREPVDTCANYLCAYLDMLHYDEYLAAGLPIASGVIEGACRYLVKDRMERTGARWSLEGAEAVLRLRAVYVNGDFEEYWQFHLLKEWQRNHASLFDLPPQRSHPKPASTPTKSALQPRK